MLANVNLVHARFGCSIGTRSFLQTETAKNRPPRGDDAKIYDLLQTCLDLFSNSSLKYLDRWNYSQRHQVPFCGITPSQLLQPKLLESIFAWNQ